MGKEAGEKCQEKLHHSLAFPWWPKGKFLLSGHLQALWAHRCQVLQFRTDEVRMWLILGDRYFQGRIVGRSSQLH